MDHIAQCIAQSRTLFANEWILQGDASISRSELWLQNHPSSQLTFQVPCLNGSWSSSSSNQSNVDTTCCALSCKNVSLDKSRIPGRIWRPARSALVGKRTMTVWIKKHSRNRSLFRMTRVKGWNGVAHIQRTTSNAHGQDRGMRYSHIGSKWEAYSTKSKVKSLPMLFSYMCLFQTDLGHTVFVFLVTLSDCSGNGWLVV